jgi:GMP synthase (glutamine-hydrolysing)
VIGEITKEKLDILLGVGRDSETGDRQAEKASRSVFSASSPTQKASRGGRFQNIRLHARSASRRHERLMTCEFGAPAVFVISRISTRIINEVRGIGRVVYDRDGQAARHVEWE